MGKGVELPHPEGQPQSEAASQPLPKLGRRGGGRSTKFEQRKKGEKMPLLFLSESELKKGVWEKKGECSLPLPTDRHSSPPDGKTFTPLPSKESLHTTAPLKTHFFAGSVLYGPLLQRKSCWIYQYPLLRGKKKKVGEDGEGAQCPHEQGHTNTTSALLSTMLSGGCKLAILAIFFFKKGVTPESATA